MGVGRGFLQPFPPREGPQQLLAARGCLAHSAKHSTLNRETRERGRERRIPPLGRLPGAGGGPAGSHLLPLVVGLSHLDVPHQAAPGAGIQDVDNGGHQVVDVHGLGVVRQAQLREEPGISEPSNHRPRHFHAPLSDLQEILVTSQQKVVLRQLCSCSPTCSCPFAHGDSVPLPHRSRSSCSRRALCSWSTSS